MSTLTPWGFSIPIYESTSSDDARFVLGTAGENPLVCFGLNPSTANRTHSDLTVRIVSNLAKPPFDSFLMFNLSPERSTDPNGMGASINPLWKAWNERVVADLIAGRHLRAYAAWGAHIRKRTYLTNGLLDILRLPELRNLSWVSRRTTSAGHPHHPRGVARVEPFAQFYVKNYSKQLPLP